MNKLELSDLLKLTDAEGALIVDTKGKLIKSENIKSENNIAAMLSVMIDMCKKFSEDMGTGDFTQLIIKMQEGVFIIDELDNLGIVAIYSRDLTKAGLMKVAMDKLIKEQEI